MNFKRITSPEHPLYEEAINLYKISFPLHEQREEASQIEILTATRKIDEYSKRAKELWGQTPEYKEKTKNWTEDDFEWTWKDVCW